MRHNRRQNNKQNRRRRRRLQMPRPLSTFAHRLQTATPSIPLELDFQPPLKGRTTLENIKIVCDQHRRFFSVMKRANRRSRWLIYGFVALTVYNFVYFHLFLPVGPAHAFLPDIFSDIPNPVNSNAFGNTGFRLGNALIQNAFGFARRIYQGEFGILRTISEVVLWFATPVVAAAVVVNLNDDESGDLFSKPWVLGSLLLIVGLSAGGKGIGIAYITLFNILEGIAGSLDKALSLNDGIASAKGYVTVNAAVSSAVAECQSFTGQEQKRCIFEASTSAATMIEGVSKAFDQDSHSWPSIWRGKMLDVAGDILNPDTNLSAKASNLFFLYSAPKLETLLAYISNIVITGVSVFYALVMAYLGLGLPIMGLSSLLVPQWRAGWVAWFISVLGIWAGRVMYLLMAWGLSKILEESTGVEILSTGWFTALSAFAAPYFAFKLAKGGAAAVYSGIVNAAGSAAAPVIGAAASVAGTAVAGPPGAAVAGGIASSATSSAGGAFGNDTSDVSGPPRVNIS